MLGQTVLAEVSMVTYYVGNNRHNSSITGAIGLAKALILQQSSEKIHDLIIFRTTLTKSGSTLNMVPMLNRIENHLTPQQFLAIIDWKDKLVSHEEWDRQLKDRASKLVI